MTETAIPTASSHPAPDQGGQRRLRDRTSWRMGWLLVAVAVLMLTALLSLAVGSKPMPLGDVVHALLRDRSSDDGVVILSLRLPRTLLGIAVGAALGLAGALMQALTRNPLADPGLLGVNAGAAAAVAMGIGVFGLTSTSQYVWFALVGAAAASVLVYALGSGGRAGATAVRLTLAGAAIAAVLTAVITGLTLVDRETFDSYRFWAVGAVAGRSLGVLWQVGPFLLVGTLLALGLARSLNAIALGDDAGRAVGAHLSRTRAVGVLAVTLLCGAATAAAGPIGFVGLTVPHVARAFTGPDQRWLLPCSMVLAPVLLLGSDILGRVLARPGEIEVGIVTAFVGAPVLILIARRRRMVGL